ncbi:MAG: hypothetical protein ACR2JT_06275 [Nocardioidaceae bacterium]
MAQERPGRRLRALGVATGVSLVLVTVWAQPDGDDRGIMARSNCQLAVRARLPNPDSSSFALIGSTVQESPSGFLITGTVDSRNDSDVRKRRRFRCAADDAGEVLYAELFDPVVVPEDQ